jgi:hypothetical protein
MTELTPEEENILFYHELGTATTQWATVELTLLWVWQACLSTKVNDKNEELLAHSFFAVENFRSKLQLVDRAFKTKFGKSHHAVDWKRLVERLRTASTARNHLAHYPDSVYREAKAGRRWALVPRWIKLPKKSAKSPPIESLCLLDIHRERLNFFALTIALQNFSFLLRGHEGPVPKALEQVDRLPTIQSLRNQMRGYIGLPLLPSRKKR